MAIRSTSSNSRAPRIARSGPAAALPVVTLEAGVDVPPAVVAALTEELGLLSSGARLVLEGAAVAGDPFEPELVAAASAVAEPAAFTALDELLRCDLVRQTDVPRRFRFRHPLVRRAVYDASPGGWRLGAHERCAAALAARGASVTARVHHVERSARQGDEAAVALLAEAGEAAAQRTPATAARWFAAALRLLGDGGPETVRVELLTALAGARAATGQFADARAALLEALELLPDEGTATRLQLTVACAGIEQLLGRHHEAHARLVAALEATRRPRLAAGRGADDHAGDGRLLPPGARRLERVGRARARGGAAAGRPAARGGSLGRARARVAFDGRAGRSRAPPGRGGDAHRRHGRRRAGDPPRRDRLPHRCRGLHGSLR